MRRMRPRGGGRERVVWDGPGWVMGRGIGQELRVEELGKRHTEISMDPTKRSLLQRRPSSWFLITQTRDLKHAVEISHSPSSSHNCSLSSPVASKYDDTC